MPTHNKEKHREEYLALLAIFERLLESIADDFSQWEVFEELVALRADFAIHHALKGFELEYDDALELLRAANDELTEAEKAKRDIVVAAVDNLVDFATAAEYQMVSELPEEPEEEDDDEDADYSDQEDAEEDIEDEYNEMAFAVFSKYNDRYAYIENLDVEYAMMIAYQLLYISPTTILTYMTQGDERVRPWHLQYEGYSAQKERFPAWLIPPIEHACRCYLVEDTESILGNTSTGRKISQEAPEMPDWINKTFKESVALGGRIFSDEHPYFQVEKRHQKNLEAIAERVKDKYYKGNGYQ